MTEPFRFDEASHTYWLGERKLPSVTTIIGKSRFGTEIREDVPPDDFDGDVAQWKWVLNRASEVGIEVHERISEYHKRGKPLRSGDRSANKYLRGYRSFLMTHEFDVLASEIPMYCTCHMVAGTVDLVVWHENRLKVWDIKTTSVLDTASVGLQTAAYSHLFEHHTGQTVEGTGVVHLRKDGMGYALKNTTDPLAFEHFEEAIDEYREAGED